MRVEPAASHGIKLEVSKRERVDRQTVIDPIPALFVCVLPDRFPQSQGAELIGAILYQTPSLPSEKGQPREAEMSARRAIEEFRTEKLADDEFVAQAVLVRALLAQDKTAESMMREFAGIPDKRYLDSNR